MISKPRNCNVVHGGDYEHESVDDASPIHVSQMRAWPCREELEDPYHCEEKDCDAIEYHA